MKKYLKSILLSLSWIGYSDLIYSPNKGFHFFTFFPYFQPFIVVALLISLLILIVCEFSNNKLLHAQINKAKIIFLITSLLILNEIFFTFNFNINIILEIAVVATFSIPILFITSDFLSANKIKTKYILILGVTVAALTLLYFKYFYIPYEDYLNGMAIIFYHQWIRNWIIFIGGMLALASALTMYKKVSQPQ